MLNIGYVILATNIYPNLEVNAWPILAYWVEHLKPTSCKIEGIYFILAYRVTLNPLAYKLDV